MNGPKTQQLWLQTVSIRKRGATQTENILSGRVEKEMDEDEPSKSWRLAYESTSEVSTAAENAKWFETVGRCDFEVPQIWI